MCPLELPICSEGLLQASKEVPDRQAVRMSPSFRTGRGDEDSFMPLNRHIDDDEDPFTEV